MITATRPVRAGAQATGALRPSFSPELFDRLWDIHDVAAFIDASTATAWRTMNHPEAPPRLHYGTKTVRWDPRAVVEFLLSRTKHGGTAAQSAGASAKTALPDSDRVTVISPARPATGGLTRPALAARPGPRRTQR